MKSTMGMGEINMRIIIMILCILSINCTNIKSDILQKTFNSLALDTKLLLPTQCRRESGNSNLLFFTPLYSTKFNLDFKNYKTIINGDSTIDVPKFDKGFINSSNTGVYAVSGNTLCDMEEQLSYIKHRTPEFFITSSAGGNDISRYDENHVIRNGKEYLLRSSYRFPIPKKILVLVHPTRSDKGNRIKNITNPVLSDFAKKLGWCVVDPAVVMRVDADGRSFKEDMFSIGNATFDDIHYNLDISFKVKQLIKDECGAEL